MQALLLTVLLSTALYAQSPDSPVRVAIVGLVHDHVRGFLGPLRNNPHAQLVAIVEPDRALAARYAAEFHLDPALFYTDLEAMLSARHPEAVLVYTDILDHRRVIEAAARHGVSSMVEKPLSTTLEDALAIRQAARLNKVHVLVNYETTWYASNAEVLGAAHDGKLGVLRKIVVHDGHEGPLEIGVSNTFGDWLTDPARNGAGALFDFGCYGADLATVLMNGEVPTSVTAVTQTEKPETYPHVDDDATVIVQYRNAQAVLMPSWDWSFARKDLEVYGSKGYGFALDPSRTSFRFQGQKAAADGTAPALPADQANSLDYLETVLRGRLESNGDLSALDTNIVVMQILDAARQSAKTGRTVAIEPNHF